MIYLVKFPGGHTVTQHADSETAALEAAYARVTEPIYCRIHDEIAPHSDAPSGSMGFYRPQWERPVSARAMREVWMDCGYCILPA
jgi:hypothetical protein